MVQTVASHKSFYKPTPFGFISSESKQDSESTLPSSLLPFSDGCSFIGVAQAGLELEIFLPFYLGSLGKDPARF